MRWPETRQIARAYAFSIVVWSALSLLTGWNYRIFDEGLNIHSTLTDMIALAESRGFSYAMLTPVIFFLVQRYPLGAKGLSSRVTLYVMGVVPFMFSYACLRYVVIPPWDPALQKYVSRRGHSPLELIHSGFADEITIYIAIVIAAHAYEYFDRTRKQELERYAYQQALAVSELQALKMQLHPHFLFNTLHGIATLIDTSQDNAKQMIVKLSGLLRNALRYSGADMITLREEVEFIREYVDLEAMRLGPRLRVEWFVDEAAEPIMVPQMILQPLVENAIQHGIAESRGQGWLEIFAQKVNGLLELTIRNSSGGIRGQGTSVGLRNTQARLKHLFADEAALSFSVGQDNIAVTVLRFPALSSGAAPGSVSRLGRTREDTIRSNV